jgi:hypothetical protein
LTFLKIFLSSLPFRPTKGRSGKSVPGLRVGSGARGQAVPIRRAPGGLRKFRRASVKATRRRVARPSGTTTGLGCLPLGTEAARRRLSSWRNGTRSRRDARSGPALPWKRGTRQTLKTPYARRRETGFFNNKDSVTRRLRPLSFPFHPGGGGRAGGIGARLSLASLFPPLAERPRDPQHGATPRPHLAMVHI